MTVDIALITGSAGCAAALLSLLLQASECRRFSRYSISARNRLKQHDDHCSEQLAQIREAHQALEMSFQSARDVLRSGRLNGSSRAAALQFFRAGMSPDTAASSLGIARREIRMLARVSSLLAGN
jgi:hypothetical protein